MCKFLGHLVFICALSVCTVWSAPALAQQINVNPSTWDAGTVTVGQAAVQGITIANNGTDTLTVHSYAFGPETSAELTITGGPGTPFDLAPGGTAAVQVTYRPSVAGRATGTLSVVSTGGDASTSLAGAGAVPGLDLLPTFLDFGAVAVGGSALLSVTLTNTGSTNLTINSLDLGAASSPDFSLATGPVAPLTLAPGNALVVQIRYAPETVVTDRGTLEITTNTGKAKIPLQGRGGATEVAVNPADLSFENVLVGNSAVRSVSISNPGSGTLLVNSLSLGAGSSAAFAFINLPTTPFTLAPGASQEVQVEYHPGQVGADDGTLDITINDAAQPTVSVGLAGHGVVAEFRVHPLDIDFGHVAVGSPSSLTIQIQNSGTSDLTIIDRVLGAGSGADFTLVSPPAVPFTLAPGTSQNLQVRYAPGQAGWDVGVLQISTLAGPAAVQLQGNGVLALEVWYPGTSFRLGAGLQCASCLQLRLLNGAAAPAGGLAVTLTSNDPSRLLVAPSTIPSTGASGAVVITIPAGSTSTNFSVQGREGVTGITTITTTAPGARPAVSRPISVETPYYTLIALAGSYTGGGADVPFRVRIGLLQSNGTVGASQTVRRGAPGPVTVTVASSNTAAGQLVTSTGVGANATVLISSTFYETRLTVASGGVAFRPMPAGGTTTVTASISGFLAAPGASQVVTVASAPPTLSVSLGTLTRLGAGLEVAACCTVTVNLPAPQGGLVVTLTSSDASRLFVASAAIPAIGGADVITVTIPAGGTNAQFSLQGIGAGSATVTATASGYTSGTSPAVNVETPVLTLLNLNGSQIRTGPNDEFQVRVGLPTTAGGTTFSVAQVVRQGGPGPVTATITTSNTLAGTLVTSSGSGTSLTVQIAPGQSDSPATVAAGGIAFDPDDSATTMQTTTVAATIPVFGATTGASQSVSSSGPVLDLFYSFPGGGEQRLGAGLQCIGCVQVRLLNGATAPAGGLAVTLTSDNTALLVARDAYPRTGSSSLVVTIPAGTSSTTFTIQGLEQTFGTGRVTATAAGAESAVSRPIHVVQPSVHIRDTLTTHSAGGPDSFFRVSVGVSTVSGGPIVQGQSTREGGGPPSYPLTVTSSNGIVGQLATFDSRAATVIVAFLRGHTFTPLAFTEGGTEHGVAFDPLTPGTTDITASMPGFASTPTTTRTFTVVP
jgi:hypothetical protein